jgi:SulP family sulfate permease
VILINAFSNTINSSILYKKKMKQYFNLFDFTQKSITERKFGRFNGCYDHDSRILSFAILAGFPPLVGLYAAFIMGLVTAIFGGRPGMVSGGAGAQ